MKDFVGKVLKISLNAASGWTTITALYIKMEDDFLVVKNGFSNKIEYISKYFIKKIEIVREATPKDFEGGVTDEE